MDIATVLGVFGAFAMVVWSIDRQNQWAQFTGDWFSPLFVVGATLLGVMIRYSLGHFISSLAVVSRTFARSNDPQLIIDEIVNLATVSRKDGVLALKKFKYLSLF